MSFNPLCSRDPEKARDLLKVTDPKCTRAWSWLQAAHSPSILPITKLNSWPSAICFTNISTIFWTLGERYCFYFWDFQVTCTRIPAPPCLMANPGNLQYHMRPLCFSPPPHLFWCLFLNSFIDVNSEKKCICQRVWFNWAQIHNEGLWLLLADASQVLRISEFTSYAVSLLQCAVPPDSTLSRELLVSSFHQVLFSGANRLDCSSVQKANAGCLEFTKNVLGERWTWGEKSQTLTYSRIFKIGLKWEKKF